MFSGIVLVTNMHISALAITLSSLSFFIQSADHVFVFLDSQRMIQTDCHLSFLTVCMRSAHLIQVGTSSIISKGKFFCRISLSSFSCISPCICCDHWFAFLFASSRCFLIISICLSFSARSFH